MATTGAPPGGPGGPVTNVLGVDPNARTNVEQVARGLESIARTLGAAAQQTTSLARGMQSASSARVLAERSVSDELLRQRSLAERALAVGAKVYSNTRLLAKEQTLITKDLRVQEERMQSLLHAHLEAGRSMGSWMRMFESNSVDANEELIRLQRNIDGLRERAERLPRAVRFSEGIGQSLTERIFGSRIAGRISEFAELPPAGGRGMGLVGSAKSLLGGLVRGGGKLAAEGAALGVGSLIAGAFSEMFNATRQTNRLRLELDALIDRSATVGRTMVDVASSIGLSAKETGLFIEELRRLGVHASELPEVGRDMVITQKALNVSLETQVRLFKLVSQEVRGVNRDIATGEIQTQRMIRLGAVLGQQLRQWSVDEVIEGLEQMARRVRGIDADVGELPRRFLHVYTAAGLFNLGMEKAHGMTKDMVKAVGDISEGLQGADLGTTLLGVRGSFPGLTTMQQMSMVGDIRAGRTAATLAGAETQLRVAMAPAEQIIRQLLGNMPEIVDQIRREAPTSVGTAGTARAGFSVYAGEALKGIPTFGSLASADPHAFQLIVERLVDSMVNSGRIVSGQPVKAFEGVEKTLQDMAKTGEITNDEAEALTKAFRDGKGVNDKIADTAVAIERNQTLGLNYLRLIAAKMLFPFSTNPGGFFGNSATEKDVELTARMGLDMTPENVQRVMRLRAATAEDNRPPTSRAVRKYTTRPILSEDDLRAAITNPDGTFNADKAAELERQVGIAPQLAPKPAVAEAPRFGEPNSEEAELASGIQDYYKRLHRGRDEIQPVLAQQYAQAAIRATGLAKNLYGVDVDPRELLAMVFTENQGTPGLMPSGASQPLVDPSGRVRQRGGAWGLGQVMPFHFQADAEKLRSVGLDPDRWTDPLVNLVESAKVLGKSGPGGYVGSDPREQRRHMYGEGDFKGFFEHLRDFRASLERPGSVWAGRGLNVTVTEGLRPPEDVQLVGQLSPPSQGGWRRH